MTNKKYFFFDIDGTLTSHTTRNLVYPSTLETLAQLKAAGHFISAATGRAHFRCADFIKKHNIDNAVCEGGMCIVYNNEVVDYSLPDQELFHRILKIFDDNDWAYCVSCDDTNIRYTKDDRYSQRVHVVDDFMKVKTDPTYNPFERGIRRVFVENKHQDLRKIPEIKLLGSMGYDWAPFMIIEPDDKYRGIKKFVTEILNGDEKDIVVFGDGMNDIKMMNEAPFAIAMGNAEDRVKMAADYITDDADHDGIYNACKHMKWI